MFQLISHKNPFKQNSHMTDEIAIKHGKYFYKELEVPEKVKIIQLVVYDV